MPTQLPQTKPKPFKPRTWWTVFCNGEPMWQYANVIPEDAMIEFLRATGMSCEAANEAGYSVGRITVSPWEGE